MALFGKNTTKTQRREGVHEGRKHGVLRMASFAPFEERHPAEECHEERKHGVLHKTITYIRVISPKAFEERQAPKDICARGVTFRQCRTGL
jgi:hypothetical protein